LVEITGLVEKPNPAQAPSNLAVVGRYVLDPAVMDLLDATRSDERGEVQLTASLDALVASGQPVLGYILKGERHDLGTLADYQVANLELALADPDLGPVITRRLAELGFVRRNGRDH
jgi:UTP--glucose-1-phosphate uridylyltransferase